jgi:hypothetical protein
MPSYLLKQIEFLKNISTKEKILSAKSHSFAIKEGGKIKT